jgi:hypothetical protein
MGLSVLSSYNALMADRPSSTREAVCIRMWRTMKSLMSEGRIHREQRT